MNTQGDYDCVGDKKKPILIGKFFSVAKFKALLSKFDQPIVLLCGLQGSAQVLV